VNTERALADFTTPARLLALPLGAEEPQMPRISWRLKPRMSGPPLALSRSASEVTMSKQPPCPVSKIEAIVLSATALAVLPIAYMLDPDSMTGEGEVTCACHPAQRARQLRR